MAGESNVTTNQKELKPWKRCCLREASFDEERSQWQNQWGRRWPKKWMIYSGCLLSTILLFCFPGGIQRVRELGWWIPQGTSSQGTHREREGEKMYWRKCPADSTFYQPASAGFLWLILEKCIPSVEEIQSPISTISLLDKVIQP